MNIVIKLDDTFYNRLKDSTMCVITENGTPLSQEYEYLLEEYLLEESEGEK